MRLFFFVGFLVVAVNATILEEHAEKFLAFKAKHGKIYKNQVEETKRFAIFRENLEAITQHNDLYKQGLTRYKQGVNQFTDMTKEEFKSLLTLNSHSKLHLKSIPYNKSGTELPKSVDWRKKGYVTPVKNQGNCGSCWAFSVTGAVEGQYYRKTKNLVSLSEQQLVDCAKKDLGWFNLGCKGGLMNETYPYVEKYGLESEESYPYAALDGDCKYNASAVVAEVSSHVILPAEDENALQDAVANIGPITVGIDATDIQFYQTGIFDSVWCSTYMQNHAVLVVGYGSENETDYWLVKNSWTKDWGENGYARIILGVNECGIANEPIYPIIN